MGTFLFSLIFNLFIAQTGDVEKPRQSQKESLTIDFGDKNVQDVINKFLEDPDSVKPEEVLKAGSGKSKKMELKKFYRLIPPGGKAFELSGILYLTPKLKEAYKLDSDFVLVDDNTPFLYLGYISGNILKVSQWIDLRKAGGNKFDLEAIDHAGKSIFVANEADGSVIEINPGETMPRIRLRRYTYDVKGYEPDPKFGIESLAVRGSALFVGREIPPLAFFKFDLRKHPSEAFVGLEKRAKQIGSQTGARYRNGHYYVLDRERRCIWEFKNFGDSNETCLSLWEHLEKPEFNYIAPKIKEAYGMEAGTAEALEIHNETFYVGLDNNGKPLKSNPAETRPAILVLEVKKETERVTEKNTVMP